jgi:hypothetical protein
MYLKQGPMPGQVFGGNDRKLSLKMRLFETLVKIDIIASLKAQGFKKRQHIRGIPAHRGTDVGDAARLVMTKDLFGQHFANALTHKVRVYANQGQPGTLFHAETAGNHIADAVSDQYVIPFRHETGITFALGLSANDFLEIRSMVRPGYGRRYSGDFNRIIGLQSSYDGIAHSLLLNN